MVVYRRFLVESFPSPFVNRKESKYIGEKELETFCPSNVKGVGGGSDEGRGVRPSLVLHHECLTSGEKDKTGETGWSLCSNKVLYLLLYCGLLEITVTFGHVFTGKITVYLFSIVQGSTTTPSVSDRGL